MGMAAKGCRCSGYVLLPVVKGAVSARVHIVHLLVLVIVHRYSPCSLQNKLKAQVMPVYDC